MQRTEEMTLSFLDGNEAISWGAMAAGCNFFAGYPITPATGIYNMMLKLLPPAGGICLQGEDEIASIGFCLGAAMAGKKTMTATSGPGISLYSEQLSFAIAGEIPLVIVDIQRLGPSTGSATKAADGDIQFLNWNSSGGQPVIVLCPVDAKDCYLLTFHAFNLAEVYRCPVFIAANKEVAMTRETVDISSSALPEITTRKPAPPGTIHLPFEAAGECLTPDFLPLGSERLVRQTSSTHGPDGYITTDAGQIGKSQVRLKKKVESEVDRYTYYDADHQSGSDTLVITYGVTARAAREATTQLSLQDKPTSLLVLKTLWPVPEKLIRQEAAPYKTILVIEMNLGQYVREIERTLKEKKIRFLGQMDGELIKPSRIKEMITNG